ncbi:hypothetical protein COU60_01715 [Candidatus Pacearchaeota archaeon CG10_big_fil_rev_8_21_14_0_10_34_76]|nr:MAG: hypothetical protein COU60_01715 [Candidatus Pacearchaeota archaeon CG10_big_fil_rev_8_21_14_0_10_34_76]
MVKIVDFIFFFYMFTGLYMLIFFVLLYVKNKDLLFEYPPGKPEPVSIVMPCYNAEKNIGNAIESLLNLDWPKEMMEIIIVDDASKDNSVNIIEKYVAKYDNIRLIKHEKNSGCAAATTNTGVRAAKYDYIAVADDDSTPKRDALRKMIGFLQNEKDVAAVTCSILAEHPETFMQKLQGIEYAIIAWTRKLLDFVDSVYVTPGPFALYKKEKLIEVGLFDVKNLTQDIEIVWRLLSHGYKARMSLATGVYSETPKKIGAWWKQRVRWTIGGIQTLLKYKHLLLRKGMLGVFIIPFFAFSLFLGMLGLGLFAYLITRRLFISYLATRYSIYADTAILTLQDVSFNPSVLNMFGAIQLLLGGIFTFFGLGVMKGLKKGKDNIFNILFYMIVYLTLLPLVIITSFYKLARGKYSW